MTKSRLKFPALEIENLHNLWLDLDLERMKRIVRDPSPDFDDLEDVEEELLQFADELEMLVEDIRKFCYNDLQTLKKESAE